MITPEPLARTSCSPSRRETTGGRSGAGGAAGSSTRGVRGARGVVRGALAAGRTRRTEAGGSSSSRDGVRVTESSNSPGIVISNASRRFDGGGSADARAVFGVTDFGAGMLAAGRFFCCRSRRATVADTSPSEAFRNAPTRSSTKSSAMTRSWPRGAETPHAVAKRSTMPCSVDLNSSDVGAARVGIMRNLIWSTLWLPESSDIATAARWPGGRAERSPHAPRAHPCR